MSVRPHINVGVIYGITFIAAGSVPAGAPVPPANGYYMCLMHMDYSKLDETSLSLYDQVDDRGIGLFETIPFFKLRNEETLEEVVVPETYIDGFPNINVQRYPKLMLAINLGIVKNPGVLSALADDVVGFIKTEFPALTGLTTANTELMTYKYEWLSLDDLNEVTEVDPMSENPYVRRMRLEREVATLKARVASLEAALVMVPKEV